MKQSIMKSDVAPAEQHVDLLPPPRLLPAEASALEQHEAVIERGKTTFIAVGEALMHIRDERLYRSTHGTFESYCRERWSMTRTFANYQIQAAEVAENLATTVVKPTNERQVRPLASLSPENQRVVWEKAVEESGGQQPTALKVSRIVERRREAGVVEMPAKPQPKDDMPPLRERTAEARALFERLLDRLPERQRAQVYKLSQSKDSRDRDLAFTRVAGRLLTGASSKLNSAAKLIPADPEITAAVDIVGNIHKRISKAIRSAEQGKRHRTDCLTLQPTDRKETNNEFQPN